MKILIRLPNWLGDVVMSSAFVAGVKQVYPDAQIDVIVKKEFGTIAALITGINNVHLFSKQDHKGLSGVYHFGKTLRSAQYDVFFSLPDSLSAAVMGWAAHARQRVGYGKEGGFLLLTKTGRKPNNSHRVEEYIALLEQFSGVIVKNNGVQLLVENKKNNDGLILVNFNSEAESRRMPVGKAINLVNLLTNSFNGHRFTFVGAGKDADYINQVLMNIDHPEQVVNYAGKTNLRELTDLIAQSLVLLTTDSGPAHLANSVATPVIVLFGAGNEHNTAPYNKKQLTVIRAGKLDCEPCVKNTCELYGMPKCMKLLDDVEIINALSLYINNA